jgi:DNA repair photolyase
MQQEDTWLNEAASDEPTKEKYDFFMRPDPTQRDFLGPIQEESEIRDGISTRVTYRTAKVGMVRNAPDDQRKEVKVIIGIGDQKCLPHVRIEKAKQLQGWYKSKVESSPQARPRPCFTEAVLTEPYGGYCAVGCAFCYINSGFRGYRGTGLITVPQDYGDQVRAQLSRLRSSAAGYFSSFTDPFLPLENHYHNTQQGAQAFVDEGLPVFFLSRLSYPGWAYDLLRQNPHSYAQKSINTSDPEDWKKLSPGALSLEEHFGEIRELSKAGIYVSIQVNPIIAGVTSNEEIERLFELLAEAGANHVIVKFVEAGYSWAPTMIERMEKRFGGNRVASFRELFVENMGGQKTVAEEYRLDAHRRFRKKADEVGLTYSTCYEYAFERDEAGKILSTTGVNIGSQFMSSDQCHGHRVPMYTRTNLDDRFKEVEECPPSGCLTCADDNGGKPRCGSELFGAAKALRFADMKEAVK